MTRARVPHTRVPRAPVSRPNTPATGRPERPDPCAGPPTATIDPPRVMPVLPDGAVPFGDDVGASAATVPRLRPVTAAGGGALGDGRVLAAGSAVGVLGSLGCGLLAGRMLAAEELGRVVAARTGLLAGTTALLGARVGSGDLATARLAPRLVPTVAHAAPPSADRTVLLPIAVACAPVPVACAGSVLVSLPARRRPRPEVSS